jgi:hypothetical protein
MKVLYNGIFEAHIPRIKIFLNLSGFKKYNSEAYRHTDKNYLPGALQLNKYALFGNDAGKT